MQVEHLKGLVGRAAGTLRAAKPTPQPGVLTGPCGQQGRLAIGVGSSAVTVWDIAKWPVMFVVVVFMISLAHDAPAAAPEPTTRGEAL